MLALLRNTGAQRMIAESNIEILQKLIIELLESSATDPRLGALSGQLAGVLGQLEQKLQSWETQSRSEAEVLERKLLGCRASLACDRRRHTPPARTSPNFNRELEKDRKSQQTADCLLRGLQQRQKFRD